MSLTGPALSNLLSQSAFLLWLGFSLNVAPKESCAKLVPPGDNIERSWKVFKSLGASPSKETNRDSLEQIKSPMSKSPDPSGFLPATWLSSKYVSVTVMLSVARPSQKPKRFCLA